MVSKTLGSVGCTVSRMIRFVALAMRCVTLNPSVCTSEPHRLVLEHSAGKRGAE